MSSVLAQRGGEFIGPSLASALLRKAEDCVQDDSVRSGTRDR
jgi:hypothetical protein